MPHIEYSIHTPVHILQSTVEWMSHACRTVPHTKRFFVPIHMVLSTSFKTFNWMSLPPKGAPSLLAADILLRTNVNWCRSVSHWIYSNNSETSDCLFSFLFKKAKFLKKNPSLNCWKLKLCCVSMGSVRTLMGFNN